MNTLEVLKITRARLEMRGISHLLLDSKIEQLESELETEKPEDTPFSSFEYTSRRRIYGR